MDASNGNQNLPPAVLCRTGCGFYANASFDGMCSKCYKDTLKRKQNSPVSGRTSPSTGTTTLTTDNTTSNVSVVTSGGNNITTPSVDTASPTVLPTPLLQTESSSSSDKLCDDDSAAGGAEASSSASSDSSESPDKEKKHKKNRCFSCKKKVGLTGFQCRCGGLFCSLHRYSDKHDCSFNYRELGQEQIRKNNPVVVGEKVQKI